jgi:hypothetical protein
MPRENSLRGLKETGGRFSQAESLPATFQPEALLESCREFVGRKTQTSEKTPG